MISETRSQRARRAARVFTVTGKEVLISMLCPGCRKSKPLPEFGLRRMADGSVRNQPRCRGCRPGKKKAPLSAPAPPIWWWRCPTMAECVCEFGWECSGLGTIYCDGCGGDQCICRCGGEIECPGCAYCGDGDDFCGDDYDADVGPDEADNG